MNGDHVQLANHGTSALARSAQASVPRDFVVLELLQTKKLATLLNEIKRRRLTREALDRALKEMGAPAMQSVLGYELGSPFHTTAVHHIFDVGQQMAMQWIVQNLPELLMTTLTTSLLTPVHVLAQRPVVQAPREFMLKLFGEKLQTAYCRARDKLGYTPLHYLALYGHQEAYDAVAQRAPLLCNMIAFDQQTPASLLVMRLKDTLAEAREENSRLLAEGDSVIVGNGSIIEQLQAHIVERGREMEKYEKRIKDLLEEQTKLRERETDLQTELAGRARELDEMRTACADARDEATRARKAFADAVDELSVSQEDMKRLRGELGTLKDRLVENSAQAESNAAKSRELAETIERLRDARRQAEEALLDGGDASDEVAQRNIRLTTQVGDLEDEIELLQEQTRAVELDKQRLEHEKERLADEREAAEALLTQQTRERDVLEERVREAQVQTDLLEAQMQAINERYRSAEMQVEKLRQETRELRKQTRDASAKHQEELNKLLMEKEAMRAQLQDAQSAARAAEERALAEITAANHDVVTLRTEAQRASERAAELELKLAAARAQAQADLDVIRAESAAQMEALRAESAERSTSEVTSAWLAELDAKQAELESQLAAKEAELGAKLNEQSRLAAQSVEERDKLGDQLAETQSRIAALEASALANQENALKWENYSSEVQTRADESVRALQQKLSEAEQRLRQTRRELDEQRELATQRAKATEIAVALTENGADDSPPKLSRTNTLRRLQNSGARERPSSVNSAIDDDDLGESALRGAQRMSVADTKQLISVHNMELNQKFFADLYSAVREGNHQLLTQYFNMGVNPNTRTYDTASGRTLLEVAVRAAFEVHQARKLMGEDGERLLANLTKTVPLIIQRGGDWDELESFMETNRGLLPDKFYSVLKSRDDISPFCKSLLDGRPDLAEAAMPTVENFNRVPSKHEKEGLSYLHIAVRQGYARLVQSMILTGRVDVHVKDANFRTPLHFLLQKCTDPTTRLMIAQYLLAGGARPTEPCMYDKLINQCRQQMSSLGEPTNKARSLARLLKRPSGQNVSLKDGIGKLSTEAEKYGTPVALARSLGDPELLDCLTNRRYLRVTIEEDEAEQYNTPLLQEYIIKVVSLNVVVEEMLAAGQLTEKSDIYALYKRYRNVFHCFNPNFGKQLGYQMVRDEINDAAGIDKYNTSTAYEAERGALLVKLIEKDETIITTHQIASRAYSANGAAAGNASLMWEVCSLLMQCTKAVSEHWFDVSNMLENPARELYPYAVQRALRHFVKNNRVNALDYMFSRSDLFGKIDVNIVVDHRQELTGIEYAAQLGVADTLEFFLERQLLRIDKPNAQGRTLVSLASAAGQPISIVTIDHFKWTNKLERDERFRCRNSAHYGILSDDMQNSVLHQCARQQRGDLLSFALNQIMFLLNAKNKNGHTPLDVANQTYNFQKNSFKDAAHERRAGECAKLLKAELDQLGSLMPDERARMREATYNLLDRPPSARGPLRPPNELDCADEVIDLGAPPALVLPPALVFPPPIVSLAQHDLSKLHANSMNQPTDEGSISSRRRHKHRHRADGEALDEGVSRRRHRTEKDDESEQAHRRRHKSKK